MFYKPLPDIYSFEKERGISAIYDFSFYLVSRYKNDTGAKYRKKEVISKALTNVLGNLFIKYRKSNYTKMKQNLGNLQEMEAILLFPVSHIHYGKNIKVVKKEAEKDYSIVRINIEKFGLSWRNQEHIRDILKHYNIIDEEIGKYKGENTVVSVKDMLDWENSVFQKTVEMNLGIYSAMNGKYLNDAFFESKYPEKPQSYTKYTKNIWLPASKNQIQTTQKINELWPVNIRESFEYYRVFSQSEKRGGRFYSEFNYMTKIMRKRLITDPFGYEEIDITAFVPNAIKAFIDGEVYNERPYNRVSRRIIKSKYRKKGDQQRKEEAINEYEEIVANIIKQPLLILLNLKNGIEGNINLEVVIWRILQETGIANTLFEKNKSRTLAEERFRKEEKKMIGMYRNKVLKEMRERRWHKNFGDDVPLPSFTINPKNVLNAVYAELKELRSYIFKENWYWTQLIESELLVSVCDELKKDGLLPLLIHDAFIVPKELSEKYSKKAETLFLEKVKEYKDSIITEEYLEKARTRIQKNLLKFISQSTLEELKAISQEGNLSGQFLKDKTMEIIRNAKQVIGKSKKDSDKFYYSIMVRGYWDLYRLVKEMILEIVQDYTVHETD